MAHWTEKTWMMGPIGQKAMALLASYKQFPNRPLQTLALGAAEFYADDAAVQAQKEAEGHPLDRREQVRRADGVPAAAFPDRGRATGGFAESTSSTAMTRSN